MKTVVFKKIRIEGFRSIVNPTVISLDKPGLNFIKGHNGAGKTAIFEALYWGLFKKRLKQGEDIVTKENYRGEEWRGTRVIVEFLVKGKPFKVARHLEFEGRTGNLRCKNKLLVFQDKELIGDARDKKGQQELIEELLGVNAQMFLSSVLFGQKLPTLTNLDNDEKRNLFEALFELEFISSAKEKATNHVSELSALLQEIQNNLRTVKGQIEINNVKISSQQRELDNFHRDKNEGLKELEEQLEELKAKAKESQDDWEDLDQELTELGDFPNETKLADEHDVSQNLRKADRKVGTLKAEIESIRGQIERKDLRVEKLFQKIRGIKTTCDVCGNPLTEDQVQKVKNSYLEESEEIQSEIRLMQDNLILSESNLKEILTLRKSYLEELSQFKDILTEFQEYKLKREKLIQSLQYQGKVTRDLESRITSVNSNIKRLKDRKAPEDNIGQLRQEIHHLDQELMRLEDQQSGRLYELEIAKWWAQVGFGASGVKAYMFDSLLGILNEHLAYYSTHLGIQTVFSMDLSGSQKKFNILCRFKDGTEISYFDLSGGQQRRVDTAIALGMHKMQSTTKTNFSLLIFDEYDTHFDQEGMEVFFELLSLEEGKSVFIISHDIRGSYLGARVMELELVNGVTKIVKS